jgi:hypothetical protein
MGFVGIVFPIAERPVLPNHAEPDEEELGFGGRFYSVLSDPT